MSLETGHVQLLLPGESGPAQYADPGYVLFVRGGALLAQPFDKRNLGTTGSSQSIAESVSSTIGASGAAVSVSGNGLLLYQRASQSQLTWVDPEGKKFTPVCNPGWISYPSLSPDGRYAMVTATLPGQKNSKLWLYDLNTGTASPFTFGEGDDLYPQWSPDSKQVAFSSNRGGQQEDIYIKPVGGGSSEQLVLGGEGNKEPDRWSADGRYILYDFVGKETQATDIWALPLFGDRKPFPVVQTPGVDYYGMFSADGKWVAYDSDESGRGRDLCGAVPWARRQMASFNWRWHRSFLAARQRAILCHGEFHACGCRIHDRGSRFHKSVNPGCFWEDAQWEALPGSM